MGKKTQKPTWALIIETLSMILLSSLFLTSMATTNFSPPAAHEDWWPMFHRDLAHTGYSNSTGPVANQTLWIYTTENGGAQNPVLSDGLVYLGLDGGVCAIDAYNGTLVWKHPVLISASPAVSDGIVYVCSAEDVSALNATTGKSVWTYNSDGLKDAPHAVADSSDDRIFTSPAVSDGLVYVTSGDDNAFALNATTGKLVWNCYTLDALTASPAVVDGIVYFSSLEEHGLTGVAYALNASTGKTVWAFASSLYPFSSPAVADGIVYMDAVDHLWALNATTGTCIWSSAAEIGASCPAVAGGRVYVSSKGVINALNAATGSLLMTYDVSGCALSGSPALATDILYVCGAPSLSNASGAWTQNSTSNGIYAFNATSGNLLWRYNGDLWWSSPAVADSIVYASSTDLANKGHVYAFGSPKPSNPPSTPSPSPSPTMPEFTLAAVLILATATCIIVIALIVVAFRKNYCPL